MTDPSTVVLVAVWMAGICFALFVIETVINFFISPKADAKPVVTKASDLVAQADAASIGDITKLVEALGKFTDSVTKASPALVSLVGAILFLAIATYSVSPPSHSNATGTTAPQGTKAPPTN